MSSSLKNKLKRCGRYHTSTPAKKLCPDPQLVGSSPIPPPHPTELSDISTDRLQTAVNDSSSSLCDVPEINTTSQPKCLSGISLPSATKCFSQSPFSTKICASSFVSPANRTISRTPLSSRRRGRISIRSAKLNFDQSKTTNNDCKTFDLSGEKQSLLRISCITDLDVSHLMENKQEIASQTISLVNEKSLISTTLEKSSWSQKTVSNSERITLSKENLLQEIKVKEEKLRKLRMVKMYRSKNNLAHLQTLIDKWRDAGQQGLQDLLNLLPEPKPSMSDLLRHLQVEPDLVNFDPVEETFT